ncbi:MAG: hypothetical protein WCA78_13195 [Rhizomicrobium sp.]
MIVAAYYIGLVVFAVIWHGTSFLTEETERKISPLLLGESVLYIALGWYLFGWKMGLANIGIFSVVGSLLDYPIERWGKRLFPNAVYRGDLSPELRKKLRKFGLWLGINRPKP